MYEVPAESPLSPPEALGKLSERVATGVAKKVAALGEWISEKRENNVFFGAFVGLLGEIARTSKELGKKVGSGAKGALAKLKGAITGETPEEPKVVKVERAQTAPKKWPKWTPKPGERAVLDRRLMERLEKERGPEVALVCRQIFENTAVALGGHQPYKSKVEFRDYNGNAHAIKNSCVGFTMAALANLPFKLTAGESAGRYLSNFRWGGKDGFDHFIPGIIGRESARFITTDTLDPDRIDTQVAPHLATGEYAIAAFYNHIFLIYKDLNGTVKMVHSGLDVGPDGKVRAAYTRVAETTLRGYAMKHRQKYGRMKFGFLPISQVVALAKKNGNQEYAQYFQQKVVKAVA